MLKYEVSLVNASKAGFLQKPLFHLLIISLVAAAIYSNTLDVPFQWDEHYALTNNPIIKDLGYFVKPSNAESFGVHYGSFRDRYVGYLTFALNYKIHGLDVTGYHIVNIVLHVLNSMLAYCLAMLVFRTPLLSITGLKGEGAKYIALFTGLLFASHPVQTEAVNYIMGRLPLLMAFFYMGSIALYMKWRITPLSSPLTLKGDRGGVLYLLSLLSAVLAMKTKENAFTLPIMMLILEFVFFGGRFRDSLRRLFPFLLTLLIIPLSLLRSGNTMAEGIGSMESATRHYTDIPRMSYFFTQTRVVVTYVRLLFLPINQNFDYDYPIFNSILDYRVLLSMFFHVSVISLGIYLFLRSKKTPWLRAASFGISWFYIALSVESSILPIPMIICEYRLYLPGVGIFMAVTTVLYMACQNIGWSKKILLVVAVLIIASLSTASYKRNNIWRNEIRLWEDVVRKSPNKGEPRFILGTNYHRYGKYDKAIEQYLYALSIKPAYDSLHSVHNNLAISYYRKGQVEKALEQLDLAIKLKPDYADAYGNMQKIKADLKAGEKAPELMKNDGD